MKKYLLLTLSILGLFATTTSHATCNTLCRQGWYIGGFGGANFMDVDKDNGISIDMETGYYAGGCIGYKFSSPLRLEGEVAYRRNNFDKAKFEGDKYGLSGNLTTWTYMANLYYDFDMGCAFTPYLGVGAGYADTKGTVKIEDVKGKGRDDGFAYQGIAGVSYALCENVDLGLEYRYLGEKKNVRDHSVGLSIKQYF